MCPEYSSKNCTYLGRNFDFSDCFTSAHRSLSAFNSTLASPVITTEENFELIKPITEDEIYSAVFQMDPHKAPDSDRFGASFFQDHWVVIKDLLCFAIKDFFQSEKPVSYTHLTLPTNREV